MNYLNLGRVYKDRRIRSIDELETWYECLLEKEKLNLVTRAFHNNEVLYYEKVIYSRKYYFHLSGDRTVIIDEEQVLRRFSLKSLQYLRQRYGGGTDECPY